jgi:predicted SAM-dependent methyltransferase
LVDAKRPILPEANSVRGALPRHHRSPTIVSNFLSRILGNGATRFSLARLMAEEPGLASAFLWEANALPVQLPDPLWLHLGCGENVLDGFLNLDFIPHDRRVVPWQMLDPWPGAWPARAAGALSEDALEHFFLAEQLYILCEMNRALVDGGVLRVLMPSWRRLLEYCRDFEPRPGEFLYATFGVETEADAVNMGMRFSGHRWLHDDASLAHLATTCAQSTVPFLWNRNLRSEGDSASFAHDLVKRHGLERIVVDPAAIDGIDILENPREGIAFGEIREAGARISWRLPAPIAPGAIACVNARSANLSSFREHSLKRLRFHGAGGEGAWPLDETLKSRACMNLAMGAAVRLACADRVTGIEEVALEPGAAGDRVTIGPLEVFYFPRSGS